MIGNIPNLYYAANNPSEAVYSRLMEIESRLLTCGLHVVGKPPTAEEAISTLVNIGSLDREEEGIKGLPRIIAESIDRQLEELGRPRIDVEIGCSGVFRDLFINQINLLDQAVKMAAEADEPLEMNFNSVLTFILRCL